MKHIVCYSGGVESALAAIEVARLYRREDVVLLNHDNGIAAGGSAAAGTGI